MISAGNQIAAARAWLGPMRILATFKSEGVDIVSDPKPPIMRGVPHG